MIPSQTAFAKQALYPESAVKQEECSGDEEDESGLAEMWTKCDRTTLSVSLGDYLTADDSVYTFGELMVSDIIHEVHSIFGASTAEEN